MKSALRKMHFSLFNPVIAAINSNLHFNVERIVSEIESNSMLNCELKITENLTQDSY